MVLVRRTGRGNVVGDLRAGRMRPGQCSGEGDAGAGDLCTGRVRRVSGAVNGDCGGCQILSDGERQPPSPAFAPLSMVMVWPALKPNRAGDRDNGCAHTRWQLPTRGGACRANRRDDGGLEVRARIDPMIVWPASKPATLATLILVAPAAEAANRVVAGCIRKSVQLLSVSSAVREAARARIGCVAGQSSRPEATDRARRSHAAATLPCSGGGLVTLGGPWVDEAAVVEAVDDQASGVTQHHAAGVER